VRSQARNHDILRSAGRRGGIPAFEVRRPQYRLTDPTAGCVPDRATSPDRGRSTGRPDRRPVGAVLRADDPLARRDHLTLADLADRRWFQFPVGTTGRSSRSRWPPTATEWAEALEELDFTGRGPSFHRLWRLTVIIYAS